MASQQGKGEGKDQEITAVTENSKSGGGMSGGRASDRMVVKTSLSEQRGSKSQRSNQGLSQAKKLFCL